MADVGVAITPALTACIALHNRLMLVGMNVHSVTTLD